MARAEQNLIPASNRCEWFPNQSRYKCISVYEDEINQKKSTFATQRRVPRGNIRWAPNGAKAMAQNPKF